MEITNFSIEYLSTILVDEDRICFSWGEGSEEVSFKNFAFCGDSITCRDEGCEGMCIDTHGPKRFCLHPSAWTHVEVMKEINVVNMEMINSIMEV